MRLAGSLFAALLVLVASQAAGARPVMKTIKAVKPGYYAAVIRYHVFTDRTPLARVASQTLQNWAKKTLRCPLSTDELDNFVITREGLTYAFMPGALATYAEGPFAVTLTITELGPHFKRELLLGR